jgi:uncharacterized protein YlaI
MPEIRHQCIICKMTSLPDDRKTKINKLGFITYSVLPLRMIVCADCDFKYRHRIDKVMLFVIPEPDFSLERQYIHNIFGVPCNLLPLSWVCEHPEQVHIISMNDVEHCLSLLRKHAHFYPHHRDVVESNIRNIRQVIHANQEPT